MGLPLPGKNDARPHVAQERGYGGHDQPEASSTNSLPHGLVQMRWSPITNKVEALAGKRDPLSTSSGAARPLSPKSQQLEEGPLRHYPRRI